MYLEQINGPEDVKKLSGEQLTKLAAEMRQVLLKRASIHGGHFGPNFGMVEATIALHYVFESPKDKIVYDVSHQTYPHKMLTGRKDAYLYEEHYDDVTGYSSPQESEHDHFTVGHTSTSVSLACGLAKGRDLNGGRENVIAVIGDGSLSGGEALEGLDFAAELESNLIIVVNDNDMSIAENHGGLYSNLKLLRETKGEAECNLFRAMGLDYVYVDEGNNIDVLINAFQSVKDSTKPVVVHIKTQKGKGYAPAEKDKESWHYNGPFHIETGEPLEVPQGEDYSDITAKFLLEKMKKDPSVVAITSATPTVLGFTKDKREEAGKQFVDVGIAEEHAVTFAAGMAAGGLKPVVAIYSTFLQRAYDQIIHDVCIGTLPVIFAVDRAGLVGSDGETHQGIFDISYLCSMPNMTVMAPKNGWELRQMLRFAVELNAPVAVRYSRGEAWDGLQDHKQEIALGQAEWICRGQEVAILAVGSMVETAMWVREHLKAEDQKITVVNMRFVKPLDEQVLREIKERHSKVVTLEEGVYNGGFGEAVSAWYEGTPMRVLNITLPDQFIEHGSVTELKKKYGLDPESITKKILSWEDEDRKA